MKHYRIAVVALWTLLPAAASGQFTSYAPPPRPRADSATAVATPAQQQRSADSVSRVAITNMKAWVDSAAGDIVVNRVDSAGRPVAADGPVTSGVVTPAARNAASPESTSVFREGARAPDTATWLPLLVLVGSGALGLGVVLLRWRPSA